ncbi:MAG: hypothetical protein LBL41_00045 [Bifidobacteriaceae bacterium]|jgi:hypothetical protein|nr:hypothetical protein [Bifidobacteriaceae bacterium]
MSKADISRPLHLLLSLSSFSVAIVFYLACIDIPFVQICDFAFKQFVKILTLLSIAFALAVFCLWRVKVTANTFDTGEITRIRPIEHIAMPTYLGLFVISLEIVELDVWLATSILIILFTFWRRFEKVFYFNPIWSLFGYRFYEIETLSGNTMTLITKKSGLRHKEDFDDLRRINDYTFMEVKL